jgi:single-stranded-DNA-specific exonuclease
MYHILYDNPNETLIQRLMKVRKVDDAVDSFLNPSRAEYRGDALLLNDCQTWISRIIDAINRNERIMIFGDYDVDGQVSSYLVYSFFRKFLRYHNVSVRLPHRVEDGYGIKCKHIDEMHSLGCQLIITVDNGITAVAEARHAKLLGIDMVITDHHEPLDELPDVHALINPTVSPEYPHRSICGALVAFKVILSTAKQLGRDQSQMKILFDRGLPFVAIATVADCMPLVAENRMIVKQWLELMNWDRSKLAPSLQHMLHTLNIKQVETFHIGFMIAPRLNAAGRVDTAHSGLNYLLAEDEQKQQTHFEFLDDLNTRRKQIQDIMIKTAMDQIDPTKYLLVAMGEDFHEWVVGIVSGRLTEKFYKPSLVLGINVQAGHAMGSLRGPDYFNIVEMLQSADDLLLRYGGHAQAGWLTVDIANIPALIERLEAYCVRTISQDDLVKQIFIDTRLYPHELNYPSVSPLFSLAPFGQGNTEPLLMLEQFHITTRKTIWSTTASHLKLSGHIDGYNCSVLFWRKAEEYSHLTIGTSCTLYGTIKKDDYNGGFYVEGKGLVA